MRQSSALDSFFNLEFTKGQEVLGRPTPLWILGLLGMLGGLFSIIVVLQYAGVLPWAGDEATYIGGPWTGVVVYAFTAGIMFAVGYAWLTVKPWASMITFLAALVGFLIPFVGYINGTDPRSSAIAPLIISVLMLIMALRPSTNRAMAMALSGQGSTKAAKAPPPPKPLSAARKRELAEEQARAAQQPAAPIAAPAAVVAAASTASTPVVPAAAQAAAQTAAAMVFSAASSLKAAAATPASPRKSLLPASRAPVTPPPAPAVVAPAPQSRPPGFRADEV